MPQLAPLQLSLLLMWPLCQCLPEEFLPHALMLHSSSAPDIIVVSTEIPFLLIPTLNKRKPKHRSDLGQTPALWRYVE